MSMLSTEFVTDVTSKLTKTISPPSRVAGKVGKVSVTVTSEGYEHSDGEETAILFVSTTNGQLKSTDSKSTLSEVGNERG